MSHTHSPDAALTERHVQAIWFDNALRPRNLRTVGGVKVTVIEPGRWNLEAGPDFHGAVVSLDGGRKRISGDVEIHMRPSDWTAHRHAADPAYGNVAVHVTWFGGEVPSTLPPNAISITMGDFMRTDNFFSPEEIDISSYPYANLPSNERPCKGYFTDRIDEALRFLSKCGMERLQLLSRRIRRKLIFRNDLSQVFYEEMMSALGHKANSLPFRALAETLPWSRLSADALLSKSRLLGVAGLLPDDDSTESVTLYRNWFLNPHERMPRDITWRRTSIRPLNSPENRISAAARLFSLRPTVLERLSQLDLSAQDGIDAAHDLVCNAAHIGKATAAMILFNVVVPFFNALGRIKSLPERMPPEQMNDTMRLTAWRLFGKDHSTSLYRSNDILMQGLMHIHHTLCLCAKSECEGCPFKTRSLP